MARPNKYVGINNEVNGGMTTIGKIIRDAWVFDIIEETETCEGWNLAGVDAFESVAKKALGLSEEYIETLQRETVD